MLRTRNFALYIAVIIFLVFGISATLLWYGISERDESQSVIDFNEGQEQIMVSSVLSDDNRVDTIARLKSKLAAGEGDIVSAPPALTSVDDVPPTDADTEVSSTSTRQILRCGTADSDSLFKDWPKSKIDLTTTASERVFTYSHKVEVVQGSSTVMSATTTTLLSLPIVYTRLAEDSCINSNIIGVTTSGALLPNFQAALYLGQSQYTLVGYALDGFPIYGPIVDESSLDNCGGEATATGYQYHVRAADEFIIGCYAGKPITP